eukprot:3941868-Rhodomonas_salina.1
MEIPRRRHRTWPLARAPLVLVAQSPSSVPDIAWHARRPIALVAPYASSVPDIAQQARRELAVCTWHKP